MMTEGYCIVGLYLCSRACGDGGASERGGAQGVERSAARERREGAGGRARRKKALKQSAAEAEAARAAEATEKEKARV